MCDINTSDLKIGLEHRDNQSCFKFLWMDCNSTFTLLASDGMDLDVPKVCVVRVAWRESTIRLKIGGYN